MRDVIQTRAFTYASLAARQVRRGGECLFPSWLPHRHRLRDLTASSDYSFNAARSVMYASPRRLSSGAAAAAAALSDDSAVAARAYRCLQTSAAPHDGSGAHAQQQSVTMLSYTSVGW